MRSVNGFKDTIAVPYIIDITVYSINIYDEDKNFSLVFGKKMIVLLRRRIYRTSRLIGENSCCYSRDPALKFERDYAILGYIFYNYLSNI
jgi:hypothetical protein